MGLFDFLKNKDKDSNNTNQPVLSDSERFEKELLHTVARYISKPGAEVNIRARHHKTGEVIPFSEGFPEQFNKWKNVKSLADRRGIIYSLLDDQIGNQLELWQVVERFNDDRYAEHALKLAIEHKGENDASNANYLNALARTYFILTQYGEAEKNCIKALELDKDNLRSKRIYADVLHTTGQTAKAHELYNEILQAKIPKDQQMTMALQDLLGFDGDIVNSPIYAFSWLSSDKQVTDDVWDWANEEFYYSPHFRSQHAFRLIRNGEHLKGFAKLLNLSKEMPWFKEGVINSYSLIDQLNMVSQMQEDKARLKNIMDQNGWTV